MFNKFFTSVVLIGIMAFIVSFDIPKGWVESGNEGGYYEMGSVKGEGIDGKTCASIKSVKPTVKGFVDLTQMVSSNLYSGKKIKLSVYMKARNIGGKKWSGFFIKIDDKIFEAEITKNTNEKGAWSSDWKKYEIVADVPVTTKNPYFSLCCRMNGTGQLWFDNISIEAIDGKINNQGTSKEPINLDFEQ